MKPFNIMLGLMVVILALGWYDHYHPVHADEVGNHRLYLTGYNEFKNEETNAEIFRDSKTNTEFVCFRHLYNAQDNFSCVQLDPSKVVKP